MNRELCRCGANLQVWKDAFPRDLDKGEHICFPRTDCPIGLDKIHCQNCRFNPQGECTYRALELQFGRDE